MTPTTQSERRFEPARGLVVTDIAKSYGAVRVLHGVSVAVRPGDVVGLVGHNGAGKSTLLKIISGAIRADAGTITIDGRAATFGSPAEAIGSGIATVYQ